MKIAVTSVLVDQDKALRFYTDVLGFVKKAESRWGKHAGSPSSPRTSPREPRSTEPRSGRGSPDLVKNAIRAMMCSDIAVSSSESATIASTIRRTASHRARPRPGQRRRLRAGRMRIRTLPIGE
jgi:hypothetical protein